MLLCYVGLTWLMISFVHCIRHSESMSKQVRDIVSEKLACILKDHEVAIKDQFESALRSVTPAPSTSSFSDHHQQLKAQISQNLHLNKYNNAFQQVIHIDYNSVIACYNFNVSSLLIILRVKTSSDKLGRKMCFLILLSLSLRSGSFCVRLEIGRVHLRACGSLRRLWRSVSPQSVGPSVAHSATGGEPRSQNGTEVQVSASTSKPNNGDQY